MENWAIYLLIIIVLVDSFFSRKSFKSAVKRTDVFLKLIDLSDDETKVFEKQVKVQELHVELARENATLLESMDEKLNIMLERLDRNCNVSAEEVKKIINDAELVSKLNQEIEVEVIEERNIESE